MISLDNMLCTCSHPITFHLIYGNRRTFCAVPECECDDCTPTNNDDSKLDHIKNRLESARSGYGPSAPVSPAIKMWAARYVQDVTYLLDRLKEAEKDREHISWDYNCLSHWDD